MNEALETSQEVEVVYIDFDPSGDVLPGIGEAFTNLLKLFIQGESIKFVERKYFTNMTQLVELGLHGRLIEFVPEDLLVDLPSLMEFGITYSQIEKIPERFFANQTKLKTLWLGYNQLKVLERDLFNSNLELNFIDVSYNKLQRISADFTRLKAIKLIGIFRNECMSQIWQRNDGKLVEMFQDEVERCCGNGKFPRESEDSCMIEPTG